MVCRMNKTTKKYAGIVIGVVICFVLAVIFFLHSNISDHITDTSVAWSDKVPIDKMKLDYAKEFSVDYYEEGYILIQIGNKDKFLLIPENKKVPQGLDKEIVPIYQPLNNVYLCATASMNMFVELDALDTIRLSGTKKDGWYIREAKEAMENGDILYAGKYNAPDYESILTNNCKLAIESQMIYHSPEVKEELEEFGIPVLVDYSSKEEEPLGRAEWVKLYGVLTGKEALAEQLFREQKEAFESVIEGENTEKTVAFFYITSSGLASVRKPSDYVVKLIQYAGGRYILKDCEEKESGISTMNMQLEEFYAKAKDADYIIYNSTIGGELESMEQLLEQSELLEDFRAVKNHQVWCIHKNLYQESMKMGSLAKDIHLMLTKKGVRDEEFTFLYKVE